MKIQRKRFFPYQDQQLIPKVKEKARWKIIKLQSKKKKEEEEKETKMDSSINNTNINYNESTFNSILDKDKLKL